MANRLRIIEERIGRPLNAVLADIEAALRFDELDPVSVDYGLAKPSV